MCDIIFEKARGRNVTVNSDVSVYGKATVVSVI